ncbi:MAG: hypothetical protein CL579_04865 [Alteromonadaceae bacterium]|jgi:hypothetical protein|uniref:Uncharacterized protein n=1 Tax=Paraglaciecola mesophila KMM 241 TaxID=1128912 RepID=K6ZM63_9ALTE|nr:hypothetical protein [Alteromonadaceae bacterium]MBB18546.1 hypothetical protein [Rickettsiales bacterium]GAC24450.1 hypothetical protein GMES_2154 [Paraglaciecola mesophila KMM 241]|tara:strand:+ start:8233 stop:8427 length:195 start_codon:yes stop_codon:yes gene_type:complete
MNDSAIQIGLPCAYPLLCQWIGVALILAFALGLVTIVFSVLRDKKRQKMKREQRRQQRAQEKKH